MSRRWVIKLGSAVTRGGDGLAVERLRHLVGECVALQKAGDQVVLVSSGAVAAGLALLPAQRSIDDPVARRQLCAALGQTELINFYRDAFAAHRLQVAQVLATRQDFATRRHYLNMRSCLQTMLTHQMVPVVNENDVVAVTELMFTDNDELAALVAGMLAADCLVLLSDIDGVYSGDPAERKVIQQWDEQAADQFRPAPGSRFGRGGIESKVRSARQAAALGTNAWITNGLETGVLARLANSEPLGTQFPASPRPSSARRWAGTAPADKAAVVVNEGAVLVLKDRQQLSSLLPVGVIELRGEFERGDLLRIESIAGELIGFGRAEYDLATAQSVLGKQQQKPLVHYNYLHVIDHV